MWAALTGLSELSKKQKDMKLEEGMSWEEMEELEEKWGIDRIA